MLLKSPGLIRCKRGMAPPTPFNPVAYVDRYWNFNSNYTSDTVDAYGLDGYRRSLGSGLISQAVLFDGAVSLDTSYNFFQNSASTWTSDYTITFWFKFDSAPTGTNRLLFGNDGPGFGGTLGFPFACRYNDTQIVLACGQPGYATSFLNVDYIPDLNWHFLAFNYRVSSPRAGLSLDNGDFAYLSLSNPVFDTSSGQFAWGGVYGGSQPGLIGRIDILGVWKRLLTAGELSYLYNSGAGREFPF